RRQYRRLHPHHDHRDRARDLQGRPAARDRARPRVDGDRGRGERGGLGNAARRRAIGGMMRASVSDLPIVLEDVSIFARGVALLDGLTLALGSGPPTVLIGPNGAGKTTLLRLAMGLVGPTRGRISWGGREAVTPARRGIVFQRPVMLRRSTAGNLRYAL